MTDFLTLTCPNCGAQLQRKADAASVRCAYCGTEHLIKQNGKLLRETTPADEIFATQAVSDNAPTASEYLSPDCPLCHRNDRVQIVSGIAGMWSGELNSPLARKLTLAQPELDDLKKPLHKTVDNWGLTNLESELSDHEARLKNNLKVDNLLNRQSAINRYNTLLNIFWLFGPGGCLVVWWAFFVSDTSLGSFVCGTLALTISMFAWCILFVLPAAKNAKNDAIEQMKEREKQQGERLKLRQKIIELKKALAEDQKKLDEQYQHELESYQRSFSSREQANLEKMRLFEEKQKIWLELYYCSREDIVFLPDEGSHTPAGEMESFVNAQWWQRYGTKG